MFPPGTRLHRLVLGLILLGNAVAFAGLDPPARLVTAVLVLVLVADLRRLPVPPTTHRLAGLVLAGLVLVQLFPLPAWLRGLLEPGLAEVFRRGLAPLSVAPWATLEVAAALAVVVGIAVTAARMAATRTGLPALLGLLAACGGLLAVLGLAGEGGAPGKVLLLRPNTGGGGAYGPFVNHNHFAMGLELTLPAVVVLFAVSVRHLARPGESRRHGAVLALGTAAILAVGGAALVRSGSRGGMLFLVAAALLSVPFWLKPRRAVRWPWLVGLGVVLAAVVTLAWTRLPAVQDSFKQLLVIEGVEGNDRLELWAGTWRLFLRAPLVGVGLGGYPYAIGLDKPATGGAVLEQAHNDWLEWTSTSGVVGVVVLLLALAGVASALRPSRVRWLRFEYRYPLAGAAWALLATALHETVEFGLHIPLNRYLLACWVGLIWGVTASTRQGEVPPRLENGGQREDASSEGEEASEEPSGGPG